MKKAFLSLMAILLVLTCAVIAPVGVSAAEENVLEIVINVPDFNANFFRYALTGEQSGFIKLNDVDVAPVTTVSDDGLTATIKYASETPIEEGAYKLEVFGFSMYSHVFNFEVSGTSGNVTVTSVAEGPTPGHITYTVKNAVAEGGDNAGEGEGEGEGEGAPDTFDGVMIAVAVAAVSAAGCAISKKKR